MVFLAIEQEEAAANHALDVLKRQPEWALVQKLLADANGKRLRLQHEPVTLEQRRKAALKHLTFQGVTYLRLVCSAETADAFCNLLPLMVRQAYVYSCGQPPQLMRAVSRDAQEFDRAVELRFRRLMARAYRYAQRKVQQDVQNSNLSSSPGKPAEGTVQITGHSPQEPERAKRGRPPGLLIIDRAMAKDIRGSLSQSTFGDFWKLSPDTIQAAENQGLATRETIDKLLGAARVNGKKVKREQLVKGRPEKPEK